MSENKHAALVHGSFTIERVFPGSPAQVFAAWADPEVKARWFIGPETWSTVSREFEFRVGGTERLHGRFDSGTESLYTARYHALIPDRRLVYAYDMHINGRHLSTSLASVELAGQGGDTKMTFTEQAVYFDGSDGSESRRHGTSAHFDRLSDFLPQG
ncbi:MAG: SRPBCC family protein [Pseudomonadota bacterium]